MPPHPWSRWYVVSDDNESETGPYDSRHQARGVQLLVERTHLVYRDDASELRRLAPRLWPAPLDLKRAAPSADITAVTPRFP
jgi:hypothetical protein